MKELDLVVSCRSHCLSTSSVWDEANEIKDVMESGENEGSVTRTRIKLAPACQRQDGTFYDLVDEWESFDEFRNFPDDFNAEY